MSNLTWHFFAQSHLGISSGIPYYWHLVAWKSLGISAGLQISLESWWIMSGLHGPNTGSKPTRKECHLHNSITNLGPWCPLTMTPMITAVLVFANLMLHHELACNWTLVSKYGCNKEPVFPSDNEGLCLFEWATSQWVPSMWWLSGKLISRDVPFKAATSNI